MTLQAILNGTVAGDHTGEDLHAAFAKVNLLIAAFNAAGIGGVAVAVTVTAASTNNFDAGSGFPVGIVRVDINPTTNDVDLTGALAGTDNQSMIFRNVGTGGFSVYLRANSGSSSAANRFTGEGDAGIPQGAQLTALYCASPTAGWAIG